MEHCNQLQSGICRNNYLNHSHCFVICAYRESPYLEECIQSLLRQSIRSEVIISTSTPNQYILELAKKYHLEVRIHEGGSLAEDWNNALQCAHTRYVTLAHQDDVYGRHYTEDVMSALSRSSHPLIAFTDYMELRMSHDNSKKKVRSNRLLQIKRLLLFPLRFPILWGNRFVRRRVLSLGSAICCPSVTMALKNIDFPVFENNMKSNIDWQAWEQISKKRGDFVYIPRIRIMHRIHEESTTTELIREKGRRTEDIYMYRKFWPEWVAVVIERFYQKSESSNQL